MKKVNKNGMTLVEVIISMCILGAIAGMFVTVAVSAKKKNADTYLRSNEMYEQAAAAESFSTKTDYGENIKVSKLLTDGSGNEFSIVADFGTITLNSTSYGYMAQQREIDKKDTNYQLRFFRSDDVATVLPNPYSNQYCIKFYNHTGLEQKISFVARTGKFFTDNKGSQGDTFSVPVANESKTWIGYSFDADPYELFDICDYDDPSKIYASFNMDSIIDFMETKDEAFTGYIIIHLCDGLQLKTQEQYDAENL